MPKRIAVNLNLTHTEVLEILEAYLQQTLAFQNLKIQTMYYEKPEGRGESRMKINAFIDSLEVEDVRFSEQGK